MSYDLDVQWLWVMMDAVMIGWFGTGLYNNTDQKSWRYSLGFE